jgi:poly-D-alanine transfer protein DltD
MNEDLRNWFSKSHPEGNWKRYNTKGKAIGPCAREPGEPKPKCLSNEKAAKMSKSEIASAVKRKRKKDPVADRKGKGGKPKMVSNKIKEEVEDIRYCPLCKKKEKRNECSYGSKNVGCSNNIYSRFFYGRGKKTTRSRTFYDSF